MRHVAADLTAHQPCRIVLPRGQAARYVFVSTVSKDLQDER